MICDRCNAEFNGEGTYGASGTPRVTITTTYPEMETVNIDWQHLCVDCAVYARHLITRIKHEAHND